MSSQNMKIYDRDNVIIEGGGGWYQIYWGSNRGQVCVGTAKTERQAIAKADEYRNKMSGIKPAGA